jgi:deoxyribodipyrimidine photolyase-related protein
MIPNIYGMSQFADSGKVMRRPYLSSSNYILKMSNYKRGDWCKKWDSLYYSFMWRHHKYFAKNYFYAVQIRNYTSKSATEKQEIAKIANKLISELTNKY